MTEAVILTSTGKLSEHAARMRQPRGAAWTAQALKRRQPPDDYREATPDERAKPTTIHAAPTSG